jgi:hypothetical protein
MPITFLLSVLLFCNLDTAAQEMTSSKEITDYIIQYKWFLRRYEWQDKFFTVPKEYQGTFMVFQPDGKVYYYKEGENESNSSRYDWRLSGTNNITLTIHDGTRKTFGFKLKDFIGYKIYITHNGGEDDGLTYVWEKAMKVEKNTQSNTTSSQTGTGSQSGKASSATGSTGPATIIFRDQFSSNDHSWLEGENSEYKFRISDGVYTLQAKSGGYWLSTIPITFDTNKDFEISARIRKVRGTDEFYFGLVLGYSMSTNYHHFAGITGLGNIVFADKGPDGKDLIGGSITNSYNDAVNKKNASNLIVVQKRNNMIRLFVNYKLVGETRYQTMNGNSFGFEMWSGKENLTLEVDELKIAVNN